VRFASASYASLATLPLELFRGPPVTNYQDIRRGRHSENLGGLLPSARKHRYRSILQTVEAGYGRRCCLGFQLETELNLETLTWFRKNEAPTIFLSDFADSLVIELATVVRLVR